MPRDGSDVYIQPFPDVVSGTEVESAVYNGFVSDIAIDLNTPRPVIAGGTDATDAEGARFNLSTGVATQVVTNYDNHVFWPGGFRSAASATNPPVASHAFAGVAYINEPLAMPATNANVVIQARDLDDTATPGAVWVREKGRRLECVDGELAGTGTALDAKVDVAGDTMTGHLGLPAGPAAGQAVRKDYVDAADAVLAAATALKANIASPTFTGDPKAPTPTIGDNDTSIATTAFVAAAIVASQASGTIVQSVFASYALSTGISTVIPFDDTIPQSSEGGHILTATIVPSSATNKLRIRVIVNAASNAVDIWPVVALFRNTETSALAAASSGVSNQVTAASTTKLEWELVSGTTSSTDFRVFVGPRTTGTIYVNGNVSGRIFGGVQHSTITVEEIKV